MSFTLLGILQSQAAGAGGAAYDLLETQVLTSNASSVTFTGLGSYSDYKHLQIRAAWSAYSNSGMRIQLNSDTGTNYAHHQLWGQSGSVSTQAFTSRSYWNISEQVQGTTWDNNVFSPMVCDVLDFSNTSKNTTARFLTGDNPSVIGAPHITLSSGAWLNTAAVTSIQLFANSNLSAKSRFSLYGVK